MKLDLHTHCHEATGFAAATPQAVDKLINCCLSRGLDGIAITEHWSSRYAYQVTDILANQFPDCRVVVLPGKEIDVGPRQVVEVYLPNHTTFRFWAHPEFWSVEPRTDVRGIEIENGMHLIDKERVREIAAELDLKLLCNSDAHRLEDIGRFYNDIEWGDLLALGVA